MKFCLVIPGDKAASLTACKVMEDLGFEKKQELGGICHYSNARDTAVPDVIVINEDERERGGGELVQKLLQAEQGRQSMVLFCDDKENRQSFEKMLGGLVQACQIKPFSLERNV